MAKLAYTRITAGTEMGLFDDPVVYTKVQDEVDAVEVQAIMAASVTVRTLLATCAGQTLADFDAELQEKCDVLADRIDYYDYETATINITELEGAWFVPILIDSFCGEEVGFEAALTIDSINSTKWHHDTDETHSFVFELRGHPKKVTKMRFRYGAGENVREQLNNITIKAAKKLSKIDDPENVIAIGVNPVWPIGQGATWVEVDWPSAKARARYIKLEFESAHGGNEARMRCVEFRVITRRPTEM